MFKRNKNPAALLRKLKRTYPGSTCALKHRSPLELLIATILSAQCTDKRVNLVTPQLFRRYPTLRALARSSPVDLESIIRSTGFYRNKAKSLRGMASMLIEKFGGTIPKTMEELLELPGVARKTANVLLGTGFGIAEGIVVDTHVTRLSARLGLSNEKTPQKIEKELMFLVPRKDWIWFSHALIEHGRRVCTARAPNCPGCPVRKECANPVNL